jgi:hypothetical protein
VLSNGLKAASELIAACGFNARKSAHVWLCLVSIGLTPYQYVLSERMRCARALLSSLDLSLGDVALAVGFSDASHPNRVFREFAGVTLTAFRREAGSRFPSSCIGYNSRDAWKRVAVRRSTRAQPGFQPSLSPSPCGIRFNGPFGRPQLMSCSLVRLAPRNKHKNLPFAAGFNVARQPEHRIRVLPPGPPGDAPDLAQSPEGANLILRA